MRDQVEHVLTMTNLKLKSSLFIPRPYMQVSFGRLRKHVRRTSYVNGVIHWKMTTWGQHETIAYSLNVKE